MSKRSDLDRTLLVALVLLAACADQPPLVSQQRQDFLRRIRERNQEVDNLRGLPEPDRTWYGAWQKALTSGDAEPALRERLRLGTLWMADRNMASRLAAAVPATSDVDRTLEQTASALEVMAPADPAPLYARGLVRLHFRHDVPGGRALICRAADLDPAISAYQESCADALIAAREFPEATKRLASVYAQATERADQCRIIDKVLQYAPEPEVALAPSSHLVVSYCRDRALRADLERRRQEETACRRACANASDCGFPRCAIQLQACLARC